MAPDVEGFEPWRADFRIAPGNWLRQLSRRWRLFRTPARLSWQQSADFSFHAEPRRIYPRNGSADLREGFDGSADPVWLLNSFGGFFAYDLFSLPRLPFRLRPQNCCWRLCS